MWKHSLSFKLSKLFANTTLSCLTTTSVYFYVRDAAVVCLCYLAYFCQRCHSLWRPTYTSKSKKKKSKKRNVKLWMPNTQLPRPSSSVQTPEPQLLPLTTGVAHHQTLLAHDGAETQAHEEVPVSSQVISDHQKLKQPEQLVACSVVSRDFQQLQTAKRAKNALSQPSYSVHTKSDSACTVPAACAALTMNLDAPASENHSNWILVTSRSTSRPLTHGKRPPTTKPSTLPTPQLTSMQCRRRCVPLKKTHSKQIGKATYPASAFVSQSLLSKCETTQCHGPPLNSSSHCAAVVRQAPLATTSQSISGPTQKAFLPHGSNAAQVKPWFAETSRRGGSKQLKKFHGCRGKSTVPVHQMHHPLTTAIVSCASHATFLPSSSLSTVSSRESPSAFPQAKRKDSGLSTDEASGEALKIPKMYPRWCDVTDDEDNDSEHADALPSFTSMK